MVSIVRNNNPFTVILLFFYCIIIHLTALLHPIIPVALEGQVLYGKLLQYLSLLIGKNAFIYVLINIFLIFLQAIYISSISTKYRLFSKPNYLVAFAYISFSVFFVELGQFNEILLLNWLVIAGLDQMLKLTQPTNPTKHLFDSALFFGIVFIFNFSSILLIIFLLVALFFIRPFSLKEILIVFVAFFLPLYFLIGLSYLNENLYLLSKMD